MKPAFKKCSTEVGLYDLIAFSTAVVSSGFKEGFILKIRFKKLIKWSCDKSLPIVSDPIPDAPLGTSGDKLGSFDASIGTKLPLTPENLALILMGLNPFLIYAALKASNANWGKIILLSPIIKLPLLYALTPDSIPGIELYLIVWYNPGLDLALLS